MAATKNKPVQTIEGLENFDDSAYSEEHALGFPPYYKPSVGKAFVARVMGLDSSDPEFERWVFQAQHDMECQTGPAKDANMVKVKKGEFFSTSAFGQFGDSTSGRGLHIYTGEIIKLVCTGTVDTGQPSPMFVFKLTTDKETSARILAKKSAGVQHHFANSAPTNSLPAAAQG